MVAPSVQIPDHLFLQCSSFPPFVWELRERDYPNKMIAASRNIEAIRAVARMYE
jgi:hypothetical protein